MTESSHPFFATHLHLGRSTGRVILASILAAVMPLWAQQSTPAGPPLKRPGPGGQGEHRPGPGGRPPRGSVGGMSPMWSHGFERLPEAEKQRIRSAMEKAWKQPELQQAKERLMKANDEFREAMQAALVSIDPEVVKILAKIKPPPQSDHHYEPKLPPPDDPEFPRVAIGRLRMEFMAFAKPEEREHLRQIHEKVLQLPAVKEAIEKLQAAPPHERLAAIGRLRTLYREAVAKERPSGSTETSKPTTVPPPEEPSTAAPKN